MGKGNLDAGPVQPALRLNDCPVALYDYMSRRAGSEGVQDLFSQLLEREHKERTRLVRHLGEFAEL